MAFRPQCTRIGMSFVAESAYGTQVAAGSIDKLYEPLEPVLPNWTQTRIDDAEDIKGHEFPENTGLDIVTAQDCEIPFSFPASYSIVGLLFSFMLQDMTVTGTADPYTHEVHIVDACSSDQLDSTTWMLGFIGDTDSYHIAKGLIINELTLTMDNQGRLVISGTAFTDGSMTFDNSYTFPTTTAHGTDFLLGTDCDFKMDASGGSPTTRASIFRGFELTLSNNLDQADGRSNIAAVSGPTLSSLRFGNRAVSLMTHFEGYHSDEFYDLWLNKTNQEIVVECVKSASRSFSMTATYARVANINESFDGIRNVIDVEWKLFYDDTPAAPAVFTIKNADAAYVT